MDSIHEGHDLGKFDGYLQTAEFRTVEALAKDFREEFGISIDAHPGGVGSEPGAINRAFRVAAELIIGGIIMQGDDHSAVLTWVLWRVAVQRLAGLRVTGYSTETLLDMEPGLGDAWLAYVALAPGTVVEDLLGPNEWPRAAK
jgi:hypothetical protein